MLSVSFPFLKFLNLVKCSKRGPLKNFFQQLFFKFQLRSQGFMTGRLRNSLTQLGSIYARFFLILVFFQLLMKIFIVVASNEARVTFKLLTAFYIYKISQLLPKVSLFLLIISFLMHVIIKMKGSSSKAQFSTKLASVLTKFKDSSTVQVGHEQARILFGEFPLKDIFVAFVSKMDTTEQMNQRQKKQMGKLYVTFVDVYKAQLLSDQYYEKMLESLNRKAVGVNEVLAHICKTLLSRIQDYEQLLPFISIILSVFHNHPQIAKILKQIAETVNPNTIAALQGQIMNILNERLCASKTKGEFLDAVLSIVLCLQERLQVEQQVLGLILKYIRHQEWNCRKNCVDIAYALLVINQRISQPVHSAIRQLKYDKIKHVRDSVNNYDKLYQQIFGKEIPQKPAPPISIREAKIKSEYSNKKVARSPAPLPKETQQKQKQPQRDQPSSLDKSIKIKQKNENFFKNAKNSDVIRVTQSTTHEPKKDEHLQEDQHSFTQSLYIPKEQQKIGKNFEAYLKDRNSPKQRQIIPVVKKPPTIQKESEVRKALIKFQTLKSQQKNKFNYQSEFQNFRKKQKIAEVQVKHQKKQDQRSIVSFAQQPIDKSQHQFSLSYISNKQEKGLLQEFKGLLLAFEKRVNERLDKMEIRLDNLQRNANGSAISSGLFEKDKSFDILALSQMHESPPSILYNSSPFDSKYSYTEREGIESNLQQKIRQSISSQNWDEAFTIALTNNRKNVLLNLLQRCAFPLDRTVEQCILLQVRKLLSYVSALKWLRHYLAQRQPANQRLVKLREDLRKRPQTDNRNYEMLRQMLLNDIQEKLSGQYQK